VCAACALPRVVPVSMPSRSPRSSTSAPSTCSLRSATAHCKPASPCCRSTPWPSSARAIARRAPRSLLVAAFSLTALALLWLARAPVPADYIRDVLGPLIVLGASLSVAFVVLTQEAVADIDPDERGLASGIFETANHLFGGAVGVALYATLLTAGHADGYRNAFLAGAALALAGLLPARMSRAQAQPR